MNGIDLGRIAGIPFRIHWSWFLAVFLIAWTLAENYLPITLPDLASQPGWYWSLGALAAIGLFGSVLLHELGHAVVAIRYHIPVRGIRLFIFGGVAELGGEPKRAEHEILMALGGPIVTVILCLLFGVGALFLGQIPWSFELTPGHGWQAAAGEVLGILARANGMLLLFNMIPGFPLDGGRVLRGVLWLRTKDYLKATRIAGSVGMAFAWLLVVLGFLSIWAGMLINGVWFIFLGMFLNSAAQSGIAYAQMQQLLGNVRVREVMRPQPVFVTADQTLQDVVDHQFLRQPYKAYPVVRDGSLVGVLTLSDVQAAEREAWPTLRAGEVAQLDGVPVLSPGEPVMHALRKMAESGHSRLPVVERGALVGVLCRRDIMAFLEIRAGLSDADDGRPRPSLRRQSEQREGRPVPSS